MNRPAEVRILDATATQLSRALAAEEALIKAAETRIDGDEFEIARSLRAIQDRELYRATHPTFESYAEAMTGKSARRVYALMFASRVAEHLGSKAAQGIAPRNGETVRQLLNSGFSEGEIESAWEMMLAITEGREPTTKELRNALESLKETAAIDPDPSVTDEAIDRIAGESTTDAGPPWDADASEEPPSGGPSQPPAPQGKKSILDCPRVEGPKNPGGPVDPRVQYGEGTGECTEKDATRDWLEMLPARAKLSASCRSVFDAGARTWAECEAERDSLRKKLGPAHKQSGPKDPWVEGMWKALATPAPANWRECYSCRVDGLSTGLDPKTGKPCICGGSGYHQH